jgi:hypothetical protein
VVSAIGSGSKTFREFAVDEVRGPVGRAISNVEIDVMDLDVSQVVADDLGHRPWTCRHDGLVIPERIVAARPCCIELIERLCEVGSKFSGCPVGIDISLLGQRRSRRDAIVVSRLQLARRRPRHARGLCSRDESRHERASIRVASSAPGTPHR